VKDQDARIQQYETQIRQLQAQLQQQQQLQQQSGVGASVAVEVASVPEPATLPAPTSQAESDAVQQAEVLRLRAEVDRLTASVAAHEQQQRKAIEGEATTSQADDELKGKVHFFFFISDNILQ
jgi:hypothetical protein